jgi:ribonuclease P protein component
VGKAVRRNRIKRVLREAFRRHRPTDELALDLVVNAHPGISGRTSSQIEREFLDAIGKIARRGRS